jgi:hypothetical protein
MLRVPGVGHSLPVAPLEAISRRADNCRDDVGSLPRGRELVLAVGLLDASKDEVTNVEGSFFNVVIMVTT